MTTPATPAADAVREAFEAKCARNARVQDRYNQLMVEGKHGHYETMFRVVREEVEAATARESALVAERDALRAALTEAAASLWNYQANAAARKADAALAAPAVGG